jgi:hypothetical protein
MKMRLVAADCSVRTDGKQTGMAKLIVFFAIFSNASKMDALRGYYVRPSAYARISNLASATKTFVGCSQRCSLLYAKQQPLSKLFPNASLI